MNTSRFGKFIRPMAVAVALAITTVVVGIPAQPAKAMDKEFCGQLIESYWDAMGAGDEFLGMGNYGAATFQYRRAGAIAYAFDELC